MNNLIEIKPEVAEALKKNLPVIALESTIISHGMPYPENLETAGKLEKDARENNVIPATICLMNGRIKIGLDTTELEELARSKEVQKVSIRDIAMVLQKKQTGATTVAATMFCAHKAGIKVFATGGIGGVHRNVATTLDISADLKALARYPVIVVSAGAKALLDIPKTLELLESLSVPVLGYNTELFPTFYSATGSCEITKVTNVQEIVEVYQLNRALELTNGLLVANPVPKQYEIPENEIARIIEKAISEAEKKSVRGKAITPFLLQKIVELSNGKALETNIKLVENNVMLACEIAKAF